MFLPRRKLRRSGTLGDAFAEEDVSWDIAIDKSIYAHRVSVSCYGRKHSSQSPFDLFIRHTFTAILCFHVMFLLKPPFVDVVVRMIIDWLDLHACNN